MKVSHMLQFLIVSAFMSDNSKREEKKGMKYGDKKPIPKNYVTKQQRKVPPQRKKR